MWSRVPFRELVSDAVGGGWGQETPFADSIPVAVIRGTDFENVRTGEFAKVPRRHEARRKAARRQLQVNDILLEVSGGSPTSGQTTGRSLLVTERIIKALGGSVIPASFCRLVRIDEGRADPKYAYFALQDMYTSGRAGDYEHRSTGISNFQFEFFLDQELVALPPLPKQRRIADILGALDDKIELNRCMSQTLESLVRGYVDRAVADRPKVPYGSAFQVRMGAPFKGAAFSAPGSGRPLLRIRDLKTFVSDTWTTEIRGDETTIGPGDIVVGMDAEFRATLWLGEESVLNQRVCSFRGIDRVGRAFVLAAVRPDLEFQEQAKTGTTVIHLNKADIDTFTVPELSATEHRHLATATEPLIEFVVAHSAQNHSLIAIRDALIPRLLSNRIRVPQEVSA